VRRRLLDMSNTASIDFAPGLEGVVANGEHAVAIIDWSAERGGKRLEGKEVAVYRIQDDKVAETSFHQDNVDLDRRFWE
jgi:ketosteroid isomerase-like protein